jgi:hypothetical protein
MTKLLTSPAAPPLINGLLGTSGIWTDKAWSGINPHNQFPEAFQSVLTAPVQVSTEVIVKGLVADTSPQPPEGAMVLVTK